MFRKIRLISYGKDARVQRATKYARENWILTPPDIERLLHLDIFDDNKYYCQTEKRPVPKP
jgi:hypothetical protein